MSIADLILAVVFNALVAVAAIWDVRTLRIPNPIPLAIVALYPAHVVLSAAAPDWPAALGLAAAVLIVGFVLFSRGLIGGGDVKLLAAVCLWAGPAHTLDLMLITALAGGAMALAVLAGSTGFVEAALRRIGAGALAAALGRRQLPYGLAIAAGTFLSVGAALMSGAA